MDTDETRDSGTVDAPKRKRLGAEQRREMIARAALKLFAEQGYERTTTKEIAREAGISEGTIFKYYPTKHDLLLAFFHREVFAPLHGIFKLDEPVDDYRVLHALIADRFRLWHSHRSLMKVIIGEAIFNPEMVQHINRLTTPALNIIEDYFRQRIQDGAFRRFNVEIAARAMISLLLTYFFRWSMLEAVEEDEAARQALVDELAALFLYGVIGRPGENA